MALVHALNGLAPAEAKSMPMAHYSHDAIHGSLAIREFGGRCRTPRLGWGQFLEIGVVEADPRPSGWLFSLLEFLAMCELFRRMVL